MREAVTAVFFHRESHKIFIIDRQDYLSVFPGYTAFPGGKVDKKDADHRAALKREIEEELNYNIESEEVLKSHLLGTAITPEFNPYRFKVFFYLIEVKNLIDFDVDKGEAKSSGWFTANDLLARYDAGALMAVPPVISIIELLCDFSQVDTNIVHDFILPHIEGREVPYIESIKGVRQFLPLSNTFPPANRTNSFILGDEGSMKLLVDPSPKDKEELEKFCRSIDKIGFDAFFISHHHPDHHEYLPELVERYPYPVYMSATTEKFIKEKWGSEYLSSMEIRHLKEGDRISSLRGEPLDVYEVPGHDEGQLALAPKDLSWFFASDLIQTIGTVVIGDQEGDMAKYFQSLKKVISLKPKFVIPSHGIAIGGTHKLEMTLKHRLHREEQIKELLQSGKDADEILAIVYEGLEKRLIKYARKTIHAHIKKIENES